MGAEALQFKLVATKSAMARGRSVTQSAEEPLFLRSTAAYNAFASLGALYTERGGVCIGSRLTIYEAEDAWRTLHLPLLMFTTICGTEAILGAIRRTMIGEDRRGGESNGPSATSYRLRVTSPSCACVRRAAWA